MVLRLVYLVYHRDLEPQVLRHRSLALRSSEDREHHLLVHRLDVDREHHLLVGQLVLVVGRHRDLN